MSRTNMPPKLHKPKKVNYINDTPIKQSTHLKILMCTLIGIPVVKSATLFYAKTCYDNVNSGYEKCDFKY